MNDRQEKLVNAAIALLTIAIEHTCSNRTADEVTKAAIIVLEEAKQ